MHYTTIISRQCTYYLRFWMLFFPLCILSVAWYCIGFNGIHLIFLRHQLWIESHISSISPHPEPLTQFLNWIGRTCRRTILLCQRALLIFFFFVSSFCSPSERVKLVHTSAVAWIAVWNCIHTFYHTATASLQNPAIQV